MSKISLPSFKCTAGALFLIFIYVCTPTHAKNGNSIHSGITVYNYNKVLIKIATLHNLTHYA